MSRRQNTLQFASMDDLTAHMRRTAVVPGNRPMVQSFVRPEREILPDVLAALRAHPSVAWAQRQNTAAGYLIDFKTFQRLVESGALRRSDARFMQFGWKGQLDVTAILIGSGRRLDVEVKRADSKPTDDQQATIDAINTAGGLAFVARGVDDVFRELESVG